jgi:ADP-heptose:LPS heptosyltransferase
MKLHITASTPGLGDHCSAIMACCGLANAGHDVVFYSRYAEWFEHIHNPNLRITGETGHKAFNVYCDYDNELVASVRRTCPSRSQWYINKVCEHYKIPVASPAFPSKILGQSKPYHGKPYIVLAPFSAGKTRMWEWDKWQYLAEMLITKGYGIVAVCSKKEERELRNNLGHLPIQMAAGKRPDQVLKHLLNAKVIIGNDSGICHVASVHGLKTYTVMSHITPEFTYGPALKYVTPITPDPQDWPCIWCAWTHEGGVRSACFDRCDALQTIEPEQVITFF